MSAFQLCQVMMEQVRDFFDLLTKTLLCLKIDSTKYLSDSTDGAASYHEQYNGLQNKLADASDQHVHI